MTNGEKIKEVFGIKDEQIEYTEPKQGHYIDRGLMWECSECGATTRPSCPCCGARMNGVRK